MREVVESIVFWKQDGRCRPVAFSDDAKLHSFSGAVNGQKPRAVDQSTVICFPVCLAYLAPVPGLMPGDAGENVLMGEDFKRLGRGNDPANAKLGDGNGL